MADYITDVPHSATVEAALEKFHKALTHRWRDDVVKVINNPLKGEEFPSGFERPISPYQQPMWQYDTAEAREHLIDDGERCAFVQWVLNGQKGSLSAVKCDGSTGSDEPWTAQDPDTGQEVKIPPNIECGMGELLETVESWAWGERCAVYQKVPLFDNQDLEKLNSAHDALVKVGGKLGLESEGKNAVDFKGDQDMVEEVMRVSGSNAVGKDWWDGWTGLAANRTKSGFVESCTPTIHNQAGIAGVLANLYSDRAAIIEKGRNDTLYWIEWATGSLDDTKQYVTDLVPGWKVVQGIGGAISISGGWSGIGGAVGATVALVGFVGENVAGKVKTEGYASDLTDIMEKLYDEIDKLNTDIEELEGDYRKGVREFATELWGVHSFNLELYDLTENDPDGDRDVKGSQGYEAHIDSIINIAKSCYSLGDKYEQLLPDIEKVAKADEHLTDKDGEQTDADSGLIELRDQLKGFLETTCGRYLLAGDQITKSAEAYAQSDGDNKEAFERTIEDLEPRKDYEFEPKDYAKDTDRGDYPGSATDVDHEPAGSEDDHDYVTEENP